MQKYKTGFSAYFFYCFCRLVFCFARLFQTSSLCILHSCILHHSNELLSARRSRAEGESWEI